MADVGPIYSDFAHDEDMAEIVVAFALGLPQRVEALTTSAAAERWDEVRRFAHQLKGAAGGYGFGVIGESAGRVERAVGTADIHTRIEEFVALTRRVRAG